MKGYLQSFDYDIFLSYGWSGNLLPNEGDRAWVAQFFETLTERLRTPLGQNPRIFLDRDASQAGNLSDRLAQALDSSALLLFVVSPGSCRPDSWCHKEAARFWDRNARPMTSGAHLILAPEDRILKVVMSPVPNGSQPPYLSDTTGRNLYDLLPGSGDPIPKPMDWAKLGPVGEAEFLSLTNDIAQQLKAIREMEESPASGSGKRVFLGACTTDLNRGRFRRLRRELLIAGHHVTSASPVPVETEADFLLRTEDALHSAHVAVFAISEASQMPQSWRANHAALQLETAFRLSEASLDFSVFAWEDPTTEKRDPQLLDRIKPNPKDQHISGGKAFEYLESNVLARLQLPSEPPKTERGHAKTICFEYRMEDEKLAGRVCDALRERKIQVQLAIPTPAKGTLLNRISKKNKRYYPEADGLVVFFGDGDYEWISDVCFAMKGFVRPGSGVIMLGPPQDKPPGKGQYDQPGFKSMKCFEPPFGKDFESWIEQLGLDKK